MRTADNAFKITFRPKITNNKLKRIIKDNQYRVNDSESYSDERSEDVLYEPLDSEIHYLFTLTDEVDGETIGEEVYAYHGYYDDFEECSIIISQYDASEILSIKINPFYKHLYSKDLSYQCMTNHGMTVNLFYVYQYWYRNIKGNQPLMTFYQFLNTDKYFDMLVEL